MIDREVRDVLGGCEPSSARTKGSVHTWLYGRDRGPRRCDGSQAAAPPTRRLTIPVPLRPGARDFPINHLDRGRGRHRPRKLDEDAPVGGERGDLDVFVGAVVAAAGRPEFDARDAPLEEEHGVGRAVAADTDRAALAVPADDVAQQLHVVVVGVELGGGHLVEQLGHGVLPWAARPCTSKRTTSAPLAWTPTWRSVGSPQIANSPRLPASARRAVAFVFKVAASDSSSGAIRSFTRMPSNRCGAPARSTSAPSIAARAPFMSYAPRP